MLHPEKLTDLVGGAESGSGLAGAPRPGSSPVSLFPQPRSGAMCFGSKLTTVECLHHGNRQALQISALLFFF